MGECIVLLFAGKGGFEGDGFFGPSPLNDYYDKLKKSHPKLNVQKINWNKEAPIENFIDGNRVVAVGHSFGGQRLLHQLVRVEQEGVNPQALRIVLIDPVRYSTSDGPDPDGPVSAEDGAQNKNRDPFPLSPNIQRCDCFLRKGGPDPGAFPRSTPVIESPGVASNSYLDPFWTPIPIPFLDYLLGAIKHAAICNMDDVRNAVLNDLTTVCGPGTGGSPKALLQSVIAKSATKRRKRVVGKSNKRLKPPRSKERGARGR
jgi:hypothetical protein